MKVSIRLTLFPDDDEVKVGKKQGLLDFTLPSSLHPLQMPMYKGFEVREGE